MQRWCKKGEEAGTVMRVELICDRIAWHREVEPYTEVWVGRREGREGRS